MPSIYSSAYVDSAAYAWRITPEADEQGWYVLALQRDTGDGPHLYVSGLSEDHLLALRACIGEAINDRGSQGRSAQSLDEPDEDPSPEVYVFGESLDLPHGPLSPPDRPGPSATT